MKGQVVENTKNENKITPGKHWLKYTNPETVGFSISGLQKVIDLFNAQVSSGALFVVHDGKVLLSAGETSRRFMLHSMRKSLMHAVYGANLKKVDTAATLEMLDIDDNEKLSSVEKSATVAQLMASTSGIYLPSAYMPEGMQSSMPARGIHDPGAFWFYNNWNFNVLAATFQKQTGKDFFTSFKAQIAKEIDCEDFTLNDTYYKMEPQKSKYPAYLFKMSARDLARIGLLYLRGGKWRGKQIIPSSWISAGTTARNTNLKNFESKGGYGMLWWVSEVAGRHMYYASGLNGHRLCIIPDLQLVVVHRVNTYNQVRFKEENIQLLLKALCDAVIAPQVAKKQKLEQYSTPEHLPNYQIIKNLATEFVKDYQHAQLGEMKILMKNGAYVLDAGIGYYSILYAPKANEYMIDDMHLPVQFKSAIASGKNPGTIEIKFGKNRVMESGIFFY